MSEQAGAEGILSGYRVLDLADEKAVFGGKLLADLGADVIKVERPGGDPTRNIGPFYKDTPDPEKSLFWFALNTNKRGITLNIEAAAGQEIFKRLVKTADFVLESFPPGYMKKLGLGYRALSKINPRLIMASVTPFGQTGPYSRYKCPDIVTIAMSGHLYMMGDPDRPPVRIGYPQSYFNAGAEAAIASLLAHHYRELTGEGQYIDVSMQATMEPFGYGGRPWEWLRRIPGRLGARGPGRISGGGGPLLLFPCQDGYVAFVIYGSHVGAKTNTEMVDWMHSRGAAPDFLREIDWSKLDMFYLTQEELDRMEDAIGGFLRSLTKEEYYEEVLKRDMMGAPVSTIEDIAADSQLSSRGYWVEMEHPELGAAIRYPGAFVKLGETPIQFRRRAPLIGEHNSEIFQGELGFTVEEMCQLKEAGTI